MHIERAKVIVRGAVQGVGFRPFVYRLATELALRGWVLNSSQGVFLEVEGERPAVDQFLLRLGKERPPRSVIQSLESSRLDPVGYESFEIRFSEESGPKTVLILPDIATCSDCLREVFDPYNRRHRYPFTNCTNCGPRFTIIKSLPSRSAEHVDEEIQDVSGLRGRVSRSAEPPLSRSTERVSALWSPTRTLGRCRRRGRTTRRSSACGRSSRTRWTNLGVKGHRRFSIDRRCAK